MGRIFHPIQVLTIPRQRHMTSQMRCQKPSLEDTLTDLLLLPKLCHGHTTTQSSNFQPCCMRRFTLPVMKKPWIQVVDMTGFRPCDIKVKTEGNTLIVHARREDVRGENIDVRERKRVTSIPDDVDKNKIMCRCDQAGHFIIKGTYKLEDKKSDENTDQLKSSQIEENPAGKKSESTEIKPGFVEYKSGSTEKTCKQNTKSEEVDLNENKTDQSGDIIQCNDAYIVSEATDVSDDDCDKQSEVSAAEEMVGLLSGEHVGDCENIIVSPVPSDDFVVLDNGIDHREATDESVKENDDTEKESSITLKDGNKTFNVKLSLKDFPPDTVSVHCKESSLFVDAKHELNEGDMFKSQEIHRKYELPENAMITDARACLDTDGVFTLTVPIRNEPNEKKVDIAIEQE
ncbi:hypothetical protein ACF0H5_008755 [Mactra antiquata]